MLIDRPQITETSVIINATVNSGTSDPAFPSVGELFFRTDLNSLRAYGGSSWAEAGAGGLSAHVADATLHLTPAQNTLLDGLAGTLTAAELNFVDGVTSSIQTQLTAGVTAHSTHVADATLHLTPAQNTLLDGLAGTLTAAELNFVDGVTSSIQTQLNSIYTANGTQDGRLSTLETTTVPAVQTNLTNHIANLSLHLTSAQNTLLDETITNGITAADIARLANAAALSSSIKVLLDGLESNKLALNGTQAMLANLSLGGFKITGLGTPTAQTDAATKDYVDSFVQGLHWVGSTRVATVGNIALTGVQTIDGVSLSISNRVLVKNQANPAENGIYLVASSAWSRSNDFNAVIEINNSAVFVIEGDTQNKSTWVQTSTITTIGTSPIAFSAFSGPVVNTAGSGISLGVNGLVSVREGAGILFDGNGAVAVDVHSSGGLMLTTNNSTAATLTTTTAQLALTNTGVNAGTVNNSATAITPITIDAKGRITGTGAGVTIAPAWSSIASKPTSLTGFGITDAVPIAGGVTMTGNLSWSGGSTILANAPAALAAYFSTAAYGTSQGDNRTHFGYNTGGTYVNFIRGAGTTVSGNLDVVGTLTAGNASSSVSPNAFVLRDGAGYLNVSYLNSTDNSVVSGVSGVMVKTSNSLVRTGTAAAIAAFISGQNFNTTGNATTATTADTANAVLWANVSGRPVNVSAFTNDSNYITAGGVSGTYVAKSGDQMTGALGLLQTGTSNDPYGRMSVTMLNDANSYGYYGMTRAGQIGWSIGIDSSNRIFFGNNGAGTASNVPSRIHTFDTSGNTIHAGSLTVGSFASVGNGNLLINSAGIVQTVNGISPANGVIRLTPNLHLNSGGGSAVILNWDNGNGGNGGNLALRIGNGSGGDVFTVAYNGTTSIAGNLSAANITGLPGVGSRIVQADGSGYIHNNYFNSIDNSVGSGVTAVMVKVGDNYLRSGTAAAIAAFISGQNFSTTGNATTATTATNSNQLGGVAASSYLQKIVNTWQASTDGFNRLYFENAGRTYYSSGNGHEFRNNGGTNLFTIDNSGNGTILGTLTGAFSGNLDGTAANSNSVSNAVGGNYNWTGQQTFTSAGANTGISNASSGVLMPQSPNASTAATLSFHRPGAYGLNMGLDNDNVFRIGGWSAQPNRLQLDMVGNLTAAGDVVAYSDRRLKTDVQTIQDPLWKVQNLEGVTFKRIDSGEQGTGLIAQDVQAVLPEAVHEMADGTLGVSYGNLAGLFVEAIKALNKEVAELRAEIRTLKEQQ